MMAAMEVNVLRRFSNSVQAVIREISVEPAYLGFALSWGLYAIVSSELYISKVRKRRDLNVELHSYRGACLMDPRFWQPKIYQLTRTDQLTR